MRLSFAWVSDFKISDMFGFKLHPPTMVSFQRNVSIFMLDHIGQSCLAGPLSVLVYLRKGCTALHFAWFVHIVHVPIEVALIDG